MCKKKHFATARLFFTHRKLVLFVCIGVLFANHKNGITNNNGDSNSENNQNNDEEL